jgi:hypothetical protein
MTFVNFAASLCLPSTILSRRKAVRPTAEDLAAQKNRSSLANEEFLGC